MSTLTRSLTERVQSSYTRLASVALNLNLASDELGQALSALDESLKRLKLGISSWYQYASNEHQDGSHWERSIGYARIGNRWGIAISRTSGDYRFPDGDSEEQWLFNDAPRQLRIEAVGHIPAMIDKLIGDAEKTIEEIKTKASEAKELAAAIAPPASVRSKA